MQEAHGSLYQRTSDGRWCVAIELPREDDRRRRHVTTFTDRREAEHMLAYWREHHTFRPVLSRAENVRLARAKGSRTPAETRAKRRAQPNRCPYCQTPLSVLNEVEDHIIPVALGGSDAIDNVQWTCWECNQAKGMSLTYRYRGKAPRPFRPAPRRARTTRRAA